MPQRPALSEAEPTEPLGQPLQLFGRGHRCTIDQQRKDGDVGIGERRRNFERHPVAFQLQSTITELVLHGEPSGADHDQHDRHTVEGDFQHGGEAVASADVLNVLEDRRIAELVLEALSKGIRRCIRVDAPVGDEDLVPQWVGQPVSPRCGICVRRSSDRLHRADPCSSAVAACGGSAGFWPASEGQPWLWGWCVVPRIAHERVNTGRYETTSTGMPNRETPHQMTGDDAGQHEPDANGQICRHEVASSILAPGSNSVRHLRQDVRVIRAGQPLPTGVVTFLLTDIEGSTQAWQASPGDMTARVSRHYEILDTIIASHGGARPQEQGEGDSVVAVFVDPVAAVEAAVEAQVALRDAVPELPVRMALHTGDATLRNEDNYVGLTIIRCARIRSCGHGGQILVSDDTAEAIRDALDGSLGLLDLGQYGLKGLHGRERIWQITDPRLPTEFPPLNAGASATGNLPTPISSFVGRRVELVAIGEALAANRLVTLVGDVGIGKTRLAMAAAAAAADSKPGGVWWVPLADVPADDTDAVATWMLHSCSLSRPSVDPVDALIEHFGSIAHSLVVVDGFGGVGDAAAAVINRLLGQCPDTQVLATGIEPLNLPGEVVQSVPPMAMPDGDGVMGLDELEVFDATRLFIERAATTSGRQFDDADASDIVELCRDLHGAPLAIELAAARVRSTPIADLIESLGALVDSDGPIDLARTLTSSIEWTYQLLDVDAQAALRRLGVFRGDIEIDAATSVVRVGDLDDRAAAVALRRLFDQQLLSFDDASGQRRDVGGGANVRSRAPAGVRRRGRGDHAPRRVVCSRGRALR